MYIDLNKFETIDLSIPLCFSGEQPNAYGVERATSRPVIAGELIGDTRRGGSVNFEQYTFIPHCSGTHTECVGHITHERISVRQCLRDVILRAILVTIEPAETDDSGDKVISAEMLLATLAGNAGRSPALIVRTLPNDDSKLTAAYGEGNVPAYFAPDAMDFIVEQGVRHLLVDMPSIDRIFDGGQLINHRKFWNVEPGKFEVSQETRLNNTITEMIYVPSEVADGEYLLNLQIAPFESDCAPSRPILLRATN